MSHFSNYELISATRCQCSCIFIATVLSAVSLGAMMKESPQSSHVYRYALYGTTQFAVGLTTKNYESTFGQFHTQNPFYTSIYNAQTTPGRVYRYDDPTGEWRTASLDVSFSDIRDEPLRYARSVASSKFFGDLQSQDFDLGIFLGEFRETSDYLQQRLGPLAKATKAFIRRDRKGVFGALGIGNRKRKRIEKKARKARKSVPDSGSQADLEYKFAIAPIISDIKALSELEVKSDPVWTLGSSQAAEVRSSRIFDRGYTKESWTYVCDYKVRICAEVKIKNFAVRTLADFGATSPVATFYQVLPLSFLFDAVFPIGPWLQQFSALDGLTLASCSLNERGIEKLDIVKNNTYVLEKYSTSSKIEHRYRRRTINFQPSVDFPRLTDPIPNIAPGLMLSFVEIMRSITRSSK